MKRIAFVVSWFYKTFTPTTILVTIFHMCTCDDVTLVNEKSIVSWKYMKSNKKCVFNVNFQCNHKQVPTAYFSMMFNIHKHISHLIFMLVPECGEYEICNKKIILRSISRQRPFFIDRFQKISKFSISNFFYQKFKFVLPKKQQNNCEKLNTRIHAKFPAAILKNPYPPPPCNTAQSQKLFI